MGKRSHVLVSPPRATSFYESFSDLIFGTLVLFIVMVMAIAVKLRDATTSLTASVDAVVHSSRFVGGSATPLMHITVLSLKGKSHVCWIPDAIANSWEFKRREDGTNPVRRMCELVTAADGLALMASDEFLAAAPGLGRVLAEGWIVHPKIGGLVAMIEAIRRESPVRFRRMDADELYNRLGGLFADSAPSVSLRSVLQDYQTWYARQVNGVNAPLAETVLAIAPPAAEPYAVIRFSEHADSGYTVGTARLSGAELRGLLRATTPGRQFRIEHLGADGQPAEPSQKVLDEVLRPVGFDRRVLSERAERILRERRSAPLPESSPQPPPN
jgi:hypothetical protein